MSAGTDYTVGITGQKLTVTFMDTTKVESITKDSVITVEYSAVLNSNAVIGLNGQENKVDLEYSNNPSSTGDGTTKPDDTDKTPEDKVIVFTYEQDIKKVDAATGEALENAVFNLYKKVSEDVEGTPTKVTYYVQVDNSNKVTGWTADKTKASDLTTGADGICKVIIDKKYNRVIGVHLIANYAAELIYGGAMMIETEMTVDNLKEIVFPHPTVCEIIREALFE